MLPFKCIKLVWQALLWRLLFFCFFFFKDGKNKTSWKRLTLWGDRRMKTGKSQYIVYYIIFFHIQMETLNLRVSIIVLQFPSNTAQPLDLCRWTCVEGETNTWYIYIYICGENSIWRCFCRTKPLTSGWIRWDTKWPSCTLCLFVFNGLSVKKMKRRLQWGVVSR